MAALHSVDASSEAPLHSEEFEDYLHYAVMPIIGPTGSAAQKVSASHDAFLSVSSSSIALGPIRAQFRKHLVSRVSPSSGSPSLMQTACAAVLLVQSSLVEVWTVLLTTPAQYCDATCIR